MANYAHVHTVRTRLRPPKRAGTGLGSTPKQDPDASFHRLPSDPEERIGLMRVG
jgi:hypothetical protein